MDSVELIEALEQIEKEKGIDKEVIFEAIETSLVSACKKNYANVQNIKVDMNRENLDGETLSRFPLVQGEQIRWEN